MPIQQSYKTGTVTVTAGSPIVTGQGTAWSLMLVNGGLFTCAGLAVPIASVESDTSLTLDYPWPGGTGSNIYSIDLGRADAASAIAANRRLAELLAGIRGPIIEIRRFEGQLQYRNAGSDDEWANILPVADIVGPAPDLGPVATETLPPGSEASFTLTETSPGVYAVEVGIPQGEKGLPGDGIGDMIAATYDPQGVGADAFNRVNHTGTQLAATISDFAEAAATPGLLFGLTLANNAADPANDLDIAPGFAADLGAGVGMRLAATLTKKLDAYWAPGTNAGGLSPGDDWTANTTYHVWLIRRPDTEEVDALFSTSPTNPGLPVAYTQKRRIGAVLAGAGVAIRPFRQIGGWFHHMQPAIDADNGSVGVAGNVPLSVPAGIKCLVDMSLVAQSSTGGSNAFLGVSDPDLGAASIYDNVLNFQTAVIAKQIQCWTNTNRQVSIYSSNGGLLSIYTRGWYDGRDTYV